MNNIDEKNISSDKHTLFLERYISIMLYFMCLLIHILDLCYVAMKVLLCLLNAALLNREESRCW